MSALSRRLVALPQRLPPRLSSPAAFTPSSSPPTTTTTTPVAEAPAPAPGKPAANLPLQELTSRRSTSFCSARSPRSAATPTLAAQTYLDLAKRTRDPRVARRAVEVANPRACRTSRWRRRGSGTRSSPPRRRRCRRRRRCWSAPSASTRPSPTSRSCSPPTAMSRNGFLQLERLLAGNPDKAANLRVVRNLAAPYPELPQAHFAVAQAAAAANDEALALAEVRRAAALRPDWESPRCSRRSSCRGARPARRRSASATTSRSIRRRARRGSTTRALLVLDKRYPEARAEFETMLEATRRHRRHLRRRPARLPAQGLRGRRGQHEAAARPGLPRPERRALHARPDRRGAEALAAAIEWYETIQGGEHALPARMRTAGAMAKQGKLDEARAFLRGVAATNEPSGCSCWSPRRSCCATRTSTARPSTCSARR